MKKSLLILLMFVFVSSQIFSKGLKVFNDSDGDISVKVDKQIEANKYIKIEKGKNKYIETGSGKRGVEWYYGSAKDKKYYTCLTYESPEKLTIRGSDKKYTMNQSLGFSKDEQLPLNAEAKKKKEAEKKAEEEAKKKKQEEDKKKKQAEEEAKKKKQEEDKKKKQVEEEAKKKKQEYEKEFKKISEYKKTDELFSYIDEKKTVLKNTNENKKDDIERLESYVIAALDSVVKNYSSQINKKIKDTEFDINNFKVELNKIQNKINERIKLIKDTPGVLKNIYKKEQDAYLVGKKYEIKEKSGSKSYASILDALTKRRGELGVAKEAKSFKALSDEKIKKEKDFYTLRDTYLVKTQDEINRLKLKEAAESYNKESGYKTSDDENFKALEDSIEKLNSKIEELKTEYKEKKKKEEEEEKEARKKREEEEKEARKKREEKEKKARKEREKKIKDKEKELELENKRVMEQTDKNEQELKSMEVSGRADAESETSIKELEIINKYGEETKKVYQAIEEANVSKGKKLIKESIEQIKKEKKEKQDELDGLDKSDKTKQDEINKLTKEIAKLEEKEKKENNLLKSKELSKEIEKLEKSKINEVEKLNKEKQGKIEKLNQDVQEKINKLGEQQGEINKLNKEKQVEIDKFNKEAQEAIDKISKEIQVEIDQKKQEKQENISTLDAKAKEEIEKLDSKKQSEISKLKEEQKKKLEQLDLEIAKKKIEQNKAMVILKSEVENNIKQKTDELTELRK